MGGGIGVVPFVIVLVQQDRSDNQGSSSDHDAGPYQDFSKVSEHNIVYNSDDETTQKDIKINHLGFYNVFIKLFNVI